MVEFLFIIINYYYFYNHNNFEVNLILQMGLNIDKIDTKIEHIFRISKCYPIHLFYVFFQLKLI